VITYFVSYLYFACVLMPHSVNSERSYEYSEIGEVLLYVKSRWYSKFHENRFESFCDVIEFDSLQTFHSVTETSLKLWLV
jgi:hypothetical protein